jgi:hypothetical protein
VAFARQKASTPTPAHTAGSSDGTTASLGRRVAAAPAERTVGRGAGPCEPPHARCLAHYFGNRASLTRTSITRHLFRPGHTNSTKRPHQLSTLSCQWKGGAGCSTPHSPNPPDSTPPSCVSNCKLRAPSPTFNLRFGRGACEVHVLIVANGE